MQIDVDPTRIGLRYTVEVGLVGEAKAVLQELLPLLKRKEDRTFLETAQQRMKKWNELMEERGTRMDVPMKPQVVTYHLNKLLRDDAIISADSGTIATWAARYIHIRGDMQFSLSGTLATMANALPYSIGAGVAYPNRQIVAIIGDGGFTMLMGEMATVVKYKLPVKVVIFKNNSFGMIEWEQIVMEGIPHFGIELQPIDFSAFARACGATGLRLEAARDAETILRQAFAQAGPVLVEAVIDPNEPPMPGKVTTAQAVKFSEAMLRGDKDAWKIIKTVVKDRIREVV